MKNKGEKIADEVWRMLPDECKNIMKNIEKKFKNSIEADVNGLFIVNNNKKCECKIATFTRTVDADFNPLCGKCGRRV